jgi:hypothetical protein
MVNRYNKFARGARRYQKFTQSNNRRLAKTIESARPLTAAVGAATGNPLLTPAAEAVRLLALNSPI